MHSQACQLDIDPQKNKKAHDIYSVNTEWQKLVQSTHQCGFIENRFDETAEFVFFTGLYIWMIKRVVLM